MRRKKRADEAGKYHKTLREQIRENRALAAVYIVLRALVVLVMVAQFFNGNFENVFLCVLTLVLLACLARAIRGPRYTDRLIALNMICTVVILLLSVLSYLLGASYLVDVIILYGLLNLLAVAVLSRISIRRHRERREEEP